MPTTHVSLAVDLGASSGRVMAGIFQGDRLELVELHRFDNIGLQNGQSLCWDYQRLFDETQRGIKLAVEKYGDAVKSVGVDTWGVDYGLLDAQGKLLGEIHQYRDGRTNGMQEAAFQKMPRAEIYQRTGIQFMFFNTLFQLLAEKKFSAQLPKAERLLFMPDLLHYSLTGIAANEKTIASTSQLLNPSTQNWDHELIASMGFPGQIFGKLIDAGTILGELLPDIAHKVNAKNIQVITPAGHDTASAVVGVPAEEPEPVFLSSGTWSCMGRELNSPVISEASFRETFSNESGVFGTTRLLKNIAGMWLLQECKRVWDSSGTSVGYAELISRAAKSAPFKMFINPNDSAFDAPANMPEALTHFCRRTNQLVPADFGEFTRMILESLALKYRFVKESLEQVTGKSIHKIYIVGGGSQNDLLNQFTADALNCTVVAGPTEASAIGNVIMQLFALGKIKSLAEGRALIRRSFETKTFKPENTAAWDAAYSRFQKILSA